MPRPPQASASRGLWFSASLKLCRAAALRLPCSASKPAALAPSPGSWRLAESIAWKRAATSVSPGLAAS
ncbi:hypothetical protein ACFS3C_02060 [Azotobacter vinelandii]